MSFISTVSFNKMMSKFLLEFKLFFCNTPNELTKIIPQDLWAIVFGYKLSLERWEENENRYLEHLKDCVEIEDPIDYPEWMKNEPYLWKPQNLNAIAALKCGNNVKIQVYGERFWVQLECIHDGKYIGFVNNNMLCDKLNFMDKIAFETRHIMYVEINQPGDWWF